MPHVQITMLEGRSPEQKRRIVERITEAIVEEAKTDREGVTVAFLEVAPTDFARAGILALDRQQKKAQEK